MTDDPTVCGKCSKKRLLGCRSGYIPVADSRCPKHKGSFTSEPCELCDGSGWLLQQQTKCHHMWAMQLRHNMGDEIASVQHVSASPLFELGGPGEPASVDMTGKNVFIHGCPWRNLLPHLKFVFTMKGEDFQFRVTDDRRIKNIFVGNENFQARPRDARNHIATFNSLSDLVGDDLQLVIIKLGYLGYKNIAAAGALKEALLIRDSLRLPTWLVEDPSNGRAWTHSCDGDVSFYIDAQFDKLQVEPADPGTPDLHDVSGDIGYEDNDPLKEAPAPYTFAQPKIEDDDEDISDSALDDMMNDPALGESGKKKWKGR